MSAVAIEEVERISSTSLTARDDGEMPNVAAECKTSLRIPMGCPVRLEPYTKYWSSSGRLSRSIVVGKKYTCAVRRVLCP